jgi:hypothetical protein
MKTRFSKFKAPHVHLMNVCHGNTLFGQFHESVGQIDGYNSEAQLRKSFSIDSRPAATIKNRSSNGQSLDKLPTLWLDEFVRGLEIATVIFRACVVSLFDMAVVGIFSSHSTSFSSKKDGLWTSGHI